MLLRRRGAQDRDARARRCCGLVAEVAHTPPRGHLGEGGARVHSWRAEVGLGEPRRAPMVAPEDAVVDMAVIGTEAFEKEPPFGAARL